MYKDLEWDALETAVLQRIAYDLTDEHVSIQPILEKAAKHDGSSESEVESPISHTKYTQAAVEYRSLEGSESTSPEQEQDKIIRHDIERLAGGPNTQYVDSKAAVTSSR